MNTDRRMYQYMGLLTIKKSRILEKDTLPNDDILPWLFLVMDKKGERRYTFFYKIEQPVTAVYEIPFNIQMSFIMDGIEKIIGFNKTYDVWRGEEFVGKVKIVGILGEEK